MKSRCASHPKHGFFFRSSNFPSWEWIYPWEARWQICYCTIEGQVVKSLDCPSAGWRMDIMKPHVANELGFSQHFLCNLFVTIVARWNFGEYFIQWWWTPTIKWKDRWWWVQISPRWDGNCLLIWQLESFLGVKKSMTRWLMATVFGKFLANWKTTIPKQWNSLRHLIQHRKWLVVPLGTISSLVIPLLSKCLGGTPFVCQTTRHILTVAIGIWKVFFRPLPSFCWEDFSFYCDVSAPHH